MGTLKTEKGFSHLFLPENDKNTLLEKMKGICEIGSVRVHPRLPAGDLPKADKNGHKGLHYLQKDLENYFAGNSAVPTGHAYRQADRQVDFDYALDLTKFSGFARAVFAVTRTIPYGETRSYQWIAAKVGSPKAWQAVGQALRKNTLPIIIPCHRVIMANGNLGGFSFGTEWKTRLLELEKIILT